MSKIAKGQIYQMNTITMSLALEQGRLVLSYVVRNDKLWEISGSTKTLIDKMLTDRKNQTKHKQEIQSLSDRIDNFSLKFTAFKEQLEKDFQDFNRAISYYIRNKDGAIKEPLNVNLHSVTYSNQQNSVYGHSKKLEKCLADFVNTTAEFWEILRFAFAERLNTKAERNFITFIKNNKKLIGDNFDYAKSFIKLWGSRKHQQDIRLSSFNFENNIFTEPKLITIRSKKFNQILLPKFIENILDYTIFLIGELER